MPLYRKSDSQLCRLLFPQKTRENVINYTLFLKGAIYTTHQERMIGIDHLLLNALNYSIAEQNWIKDNLSWLFKWLVGKNAIHITTPKLSGRDVSEVIKCLSRVCKDALQRCRDEDFAMLRLTLPHLEEAVKVN